jgi:uncharacterized protein (TIGR00251 family)
VRIIVRVTPGARETTVGGRYGGSEPPVLVVRVTAPAVDGKANAATIEALATAFGVSRRSIRIVHGERARTKTIELEADPKVLTLLLSRGEA